MMMPQMSPQISNHNNFMGRSPPQQQQQQQHQPQQQQPQNLGGVGGQQQLTGPSDDSDDNGLVSLGDWNLAENVQKDCKGM